MVLRFLFDTNIVIGLLQGNPPAQQLIRKHGAVPADTAVSQITRMELLGFPGITSSEQKRVEAFLSAVTVILLDNTIEQDAIVLRRRLKLKLPDAIVAATARVNGLTLLTLDVRLNRALAKI